MPINLHKLQSFMYRLDRLCKSCELFEDMCEELSEAIGIPAQKLNELSTYDVEDVFPDLN